MIIKGDYGYIWIVVPKCDEINTDEHSFVAVVYDATTSDEWSLRLADDTRWEFYVDGVQVEWDDLSFERKKMVRMTRAWEGKVRDYWVGLGYEDELYYALEALECL